MSRRRRVLAAAALAGSAVMLTAVSALARGGGGGHGGGGGGGGGHGGGGGGFGGGFGGGGYGGGFGGGFFPFPFFFGGGGSLFTLILLIFIMYGIWHAYQRSTLSASTLPAGTGTLGMPAAVGPGVEEARVALLKRDPDFNEQVFLDRAQAIFFALQKAWMDRNLEPARGYMSDGLYHRWKDQVDAMMAAHKKNILESLVVMGIHIVQIRSDANFDTISTQINASCADYEIDEQSGKVVFGSKDEAPFREYWTFIRSAGTRTKAGQTAEVEQCPNCGAPLQISEAGECTYCKATVTSGRYGWVLDNITQASQWESDGHE